jgi:predicted DCC family thiol-disulfide oxidoreductase YuxK
MKEENIILFDGFCNLCSGVVKFIIKNDKKNVFKFAPLQSEKGQILLKKFDLSTQTFDSFVYIQNGKFYTKSTAALKVCQKLGSFWQFLYIFMIVPNFIRNFAYTMIAKNRYKWFGKSESCLMPTAEIKEKFLK